MLHIYHDLCLDFTRLEFPKLIRIRDGGNGLHQILNLSLYENGIAWEPPEGCSYALSWHKADGSTGSEAAVVATERHTLIFEIPRTALEGCPEVSMWLKLFRGGSLLKAFRFRLYVYQQF